ncbi:MAG: PqqD family peptide modification chaperone [Candidatus Paceibacterota bacterium]
MEIIEINSRIGWRLINDNVVAFNCKNQKIVIWNEAASIIWQKLVSGQKYDQVIKWLSTEYDLSVKIAKKDVDTFLQEAVQMGFLKLDNRHLQVDKHNNALGTETEGENVLLAIEMEAIKHLIPFAATFETTYTCNEKCIHCYMERNLPSLRLSEIKRILGELAKERCLFLSLTGGEFFIRKDAIDIVKYASSLHFVIDILSNGTLISEETATTLAKYSVRRVQVSLYGATTEIHDSITRLSGSFQKSLDGIKNLRKAGVKVEIAFPMMQINFNERYKVKKLTEELDCVLSPSPIITARNDGSQDTFNLRLSDRQIEEFLADEDFSALYAGRKPFQDHQFYLGLSDISNAPPCYSGFNSCAITPSGKVLPCNQLLYEVGDLKGDNFSEIWHNSLGLQYLRSLIISKLTKCSKCQLLTSCARCPGLAFLEGSDLLGPSPENCRITTLNHLIQNNKERR